METPEAIFLCDYCVNNWKLLSLLFLLGLNSLQVCVRALTPTLLVVAFIFSPHGVQACTELSPDWNSLWGWLKLPESQSHLMGAYV